jgi:hypothetical protein
MIINKEIISPQKCWTTMNGLNQIKIQLSEQISNLTKRCKMSKIITLRMPEWIANELDRRAKAESRTRNNMARVLFEMLFQNERTTE